MRPPRWWRIVQGRSGGALKGMSISIAPLGAEDVDPLIRAPTACRR